MMKRTCVKHLKFKTRICNKTEIPQLFFTPLWLFCLVLACPLKEAFIKLRAVSKHGRDGYGKPEFEVECGVKNEHLFKS